MAAVTWHGVQPERYLPGREYVQIATEGFTAKRPPVLHKRFRWRQTLAFNNLTHANRNIVDGFIERMEGEVRWSRVPWGFHQVKAGGASGTPQLFGAHSAGATTLATDGWGGSSPYLRYYDMVGFEYNIGGVYVPTLHRCRGDVTSGDTTLRIWPGLRFDTNDNADIYFLGHLPPNNVSSLYLECAMSYADPSGLESEAFPSNLVGGHYGNPGAHSFIEVVQDVY